MVASNASNSLEKYKMTVILRDGSTLLLRPIQPDDVERLSAFVSHLSRHTIYLRFHHVLTQLSQKELEHFCSVDYDNTFALVATVGEDSEIKIIAVGRYARLPGGNTAEVAFVVEDAYQGKGIGTHLLKQLAVIAREKGIRIFEGEVLASNQEMMKVLMDSGFRMTGEIEYGVYRVVLDIDSTLRVD